MELSNDQRPAPTQEAGLPVYVLADELAISSGEALAICDRAGVPAESGATVLGPAEVQRFRAAAQHHDEPPAAAAGTTWAVPPPATAGPAWTAPPTGPAGPAWTAPPSPTATPGPAWAVPPAAAPGPAPTSAAAAVDIDPELWGRLQRGRAAASAAMMRGLGLIALGIAITLGTFIVAPGGFFIVSFGPVIAGISQIGKANRYRSEVARVERALRHHA